MAPITPPPPHDHFWRGHSGILIHPTNVADALSTALNLLEREGWDPKTPRPFGIHQALAGDDDIRVVAERCLDTMTAYRTGAPFASYEAWEQRGDRTFLDVRDILTAAAWYATASAAGVTG